MRAVRLTALVISALVLLTPPASAKEGVRAKLEGSVRIGAAPGRTITVAWRLEDAQGHAFSARGIYLRVHRCGRTARRVEARDLGGGRFRSRFVVPTGGIRKLRVGLEGWRIHPDGRNERADAYFEFDPPLVRRCG